mmetsp:Transcript_46782/g.150774  ORF Transcript_46782/g.150774 Transcript_46782/m.150774 type:complete len:223 (+) Transcript_46782:996-1664(+)
MAASRWSTARPTRCAPTRPTASSSPLAVNCARTSSCWRPATRSARSTSPSMWRVHFAIRPRRRASPTSSTRSRARRSSPSRPASARTTCCTLCASSALTPLIPSSSSRPRTSRAFGRTTASSSARTARRGATSSTTAKMRRATGPTTSRCRASPSRAPSRAGSSGGSARGSGARRAQARRRATRQSPRGLLRTPPCSAWRCATASGTAAAASLGGRWKWSEH